MESNNLELQDTELSPVFEPNPNSPFINSLLSPVESVEHPDDTEEIQDTDTTEGEALVETDTEGVESDDQQDETEASDDKDQTAPPDETDDAEPYLVEINVNGTKEEYDLNKEEDLSKVLQFANKGRFFEKEQQTFKKEKAEMESYKAGLTQAAQIMYQKSLADMNLSEDGMLELPYEEFIGTTDSKAGDIKAYNDHKAQLNRGRVFADNVYKSRQKFDNVKATFQTAHPEITDVNAWIQENLQPLIEPILTYGEKEFPDDILEMIYSYKNKEKRESKVKEDTLREFAKKKPMRKLVPNQKITAKANTKNLAEQMVAQVFKPRQIVH